MARMALASGAICGAKAFAAELAPGQGVIDRSAARWVGRPMFLRPYHLTYVVLYYGQRENKWSLESETKWRTLVNRMDTEPDLLIQVVECFDDACAGCKYLAKDEMGSVWGVGYTCRSAQKPEMVKDVVTANRYVLQRVGLSAGETILLKDLAPILKAKVPKLELKLIGGMRCQERYEKGLADLAKKYGHS